jgi:hypothetical protein
VAVLVLEALAVECRPARRRAEEEAATSGVGQLPDLVAGPLELTSGEDAGDDREGVGRIRRGRRLE